MSIISAYAPKNLIKKMKLLKFTKASSARIRLSNSWAEQKQA